MLRLPRFDTLPSDGQRHPEALPMQVCVPAGVDVHAYARACMRACVCVYV
jgi:hypothetical protein